MRTFYPKENASSMFARDQMTTCNMESAAQSDKPTGNYHPTVQILSGSTGPFSILFVCFTACMFTVFVYASAFNEKKTHLNSKEAIFAFSTRERYFTREVVETKTELNIE